MSTTFEVGKRYQGTQNPSYIITVTKRTPKTITFTDSLSEDSPFDSATRKRIVYDPVDNEIILVDIFGCVSSKNII